MKHTVGKIEVDGWHLLSEGKYIIADVWSGRKDESMANAKRLVKCWNNHDRLVEALEEMTNYVKTLSSHAPEALKELSINKAKEAEKLLEELK